MALIKANVNLKSYNTFGLEVAGAYFFELNDLDDFQQLMKTPEYRDNKRLIIGGGSNLLFTEDFRGLVIKNNLKGISIVSESTSDVVVKVAAGEVWHDFVLWSIEKNFGGIENLSLIPGCVGASPMQNIGAYGVEIKEVFESLEAFSLKDGVARTFSKKECEFGYRESVFKNKLKDAFIIVSVSFRLQKNPQLNTSYGAINAELSEMNIQKPTIRDISNAVIRIRRSKLPDPAQIGNAGSFFKNPEISESQYKSLKKRFENLVAYPLENGNYKLAAGWLIEQAGLKGFEYKQAGVHSKQALVLVNRGQATGKEIYELSDLVIQRVEEKFGVILQREVNIIG